MTGWGLVEEVKRELVCMREYDFIKISFSLKVIKLIVGVNGRWDNPHLEVLFWSSIINDSSKP